tara:strand:+ start:16 stop:588 length:573 start_codon:yes stop_codon:yes gene_type:complete
MFTFKNYYYLYIENSKVLNFNLIKTRNKFNIIYRNIGKPENITQLKKFRQKCKQKAIGFFIANNIDLCTKLKADGLYVSAYSKKILNPRGFNMRLKIIGSAHNLKELGLKKKQGCKIIIFSRLFKTNYKNKSDFLGIVRFNLFSKLLDDQFVPLGGIRLNNLNKLKIVNSNSMAILSEVKKKPAIIGRLF